MHIAERPWSKQIALQSWKWPQQGMNSEGQTSIEELSLNSEGASLFASRPRQDIVDLSTRQESSECRCFRERSSTINIVEACACGSLPGNDGVFWNIWNWSWSKWLTDGVVQALSCVALDHKLPDSPWIISSAWSKWFCMIKEFESLSNILWGTSGFEGGKN